MKARKELKNQEEKLYAINRNSLIKTVDYYLEFIGVEHSAQYLSSLVHAIFYKASVIPQHTLLDNTDGPC